MVQRKIEELENDNREKVIIDIRSSEEYEKETYPGAVNIYWEEFERHLDEVPKDKPVYLLCYTGQRSDEIAENLSKEGYEIYSIESGYRSYLRLKLKKMMSQRYLIRWQEMILEVRPVIFVPECEEAICTARQRN